MFHRFGQKSLFWKFWSSLKVVRVLLGAQCKIFQQCHIVVLRLVVVDETNQNVMPKLRQTRQFQISLILNQPASLDTIALEDRL